MSHKSMKKMCLSIVVGSKIYVLSISYWRLYTYNAHVSEDAHVRAYMQLTPSYGEVICIMYSPCVLKILRMRFLYAM